MGIYKTTVCVWCAVKYFRSCAQVAAPTSLVRISSVTSPRLRHLNSPESTIEVTTRVDRTNFRRFFIMSQRGELASRIFSVSCTCYSMGAQSFCVSDPKNDRL